MQRIKCIGCEALARLVYYESALTPHIVDVDIVKLGLHAEPNGLRKILQDKIDAVQAVDYDIVALAYGLCGKATYGLTARNVPIVIPKAHDCITLFLGSREQYKEQFENKPGTYWYALDYVQRNSDPNTTLSLGASTIGNDLKATYEAYVEKYGSDNADYLMSIMGAWQQHYQRAAYIDMGIGDGGSVEAQAKGDADRRGWTFDRVQGDRILIHRLLFGEWEKDFLVLDPGQRVGMSYNDEVIGAEK
jgi:hypothetical protein